MKDWTTIKQRYLQDNVPTRLGGLAANLARIKSFARREENFNVVNSLIEESKFFIEWTAMALEINETVELVELQREMARWHYNLTMLWANAQKRSALSEQAGVWSQRVLNISGLLN